MFEVVDKNKFKTKVIAFFFFLLLAAVVYVFCEYFELGVLSIPIAVIVSVFSTFGSYYFSDKIVLSISQARPADQAEDRRVKDSVEGLCIAAGGLPLPRVYIIDDSAPNAFATGRNPENAVICVTTGLLEKLDSYELEAVLAHELAHIKNYDILLSAVATVMVGIVSLLADWFFRMGFRSRGRKSNASIIIAVFGLLLMILSPFIAQLMRLALSRNREYLADATAIELCRNPDALINALKKISGDPEPLEAANKATANMYIVSPFKNLTSRLFSTHPPIEDRIEAIKNIH